MIRTGTIPRIEVDKTTFECARIAHPESVPLEVDGERHLLVINPITSARVLWVAQVPS